MMITLPASLMTTAPQIDTRTQLAYETVIISALSHEIPLDFAAAQRLEPSLFNDTFSKRVIAALQRVWVSPVESQPRAVDIACELEKDALSFGESTADAKRQADRFERLAESKQAPTNGKIAAALSVLSASDIDEFNESSGSHQAPSFTFGAGTAQDEDEQIYSDVLLADICKASPIAALAKQLAVAAQFPENTAFLCLLGVFSSVTTRYATVAYESGFDCQPTGLYICTEQPPATAKTRVLKAGQKAIFSHTKEIHKNSKVMIDEAEKRLDDTELTEEQREAITDEIKQIKAQQAGALEFVTDTTPEALDSYLVDTRGFFAVASAEQGAVNSLLGLSYGDTGKKNNNDLALKGYNGEHHFSQRNSRKCYKGEVIGSVCVIAQEGVINNIISAGGHTGITERFLMWSEPHLLGRRDHHAARRYMACSAQADYDEAVHSILSRTQAHSALDSLVKLSLSVRAWDKITDLKQELEPTLKNGAENSSDLIRGIVGKIDILIMKIASVLHLSIDQKSTLIHDDRVSEAISFARAYIEHIKTLQSTAEIDVVSSAEKKVIDHIRAQKAPVTGAAIVDAFRRAKSFHDGGKAGTKVVVAIIQQLESKGLIKNVNANMHIPDVKLRAYRVA